MRAGASVGISSLTIPFKARQERPICPFSQHMQDCKTAKQAWMDGMGWLDGRMGKSTAIYYYLNHFPPFNNSRLSHPLLTHPCVLSTTNSNNNHIITIVIPPRISGINFIRSRFLRSAPGPVCSSRLPDNWAFFIYASGRPTALHLVLSIDSGDLSLPAPRYSVPITFVSSSQPVSVLRPP